MLIAAQPVVEVATIIAIYARRDVHQLALDVNQVVI